MPEVFRTQAFAKVNLVLEVLGTRPDGYHEIDTVLQEIELADIVEVRAAEDWSITVSGPRSRGVPSDASNLALKAAQRLAERVEGHPVAVHLEKHIPAAGGLGGGASDSVAVLKLLALLWPNTTQSDLLAVANEIGSDEAFFLVGGAARAQGRGERVTPLPALGPHGVVLFIPASTIERKTARMFAALDKHAFDDGQVVQDFVSERTTRVSAESVFNGFERVAFDLFPWLAALWSDLEQRTGAPIRLAGAGPCLFWIGPPGEALSIAEAARGANCEVIVTQTVNRP